MRAREFIDALTATCLLKFQHTSKADLAVISQDTDWKEFSKNHENIEYFKSLSIYAESVDPHVDRILLIKSIVKNNNSVLREIESLIACSNFRINIGWDANIYDIKISDLNFKSISVLNSSFDQVEVTFRIYASVEMDLEYSDIEASGHLLEKPERFRQSFHSGITTNGTLNIIIDPDQEEIIKILNLEVDNTDLNPKPVD